MQERSSRRCRAGRYDTFVLHGVTGSGKTEVYIRAIAEAVSYGRQAIVLVPEISLTPQTIRRFRSRFSGVAVLHSHLTDSERHGHWQQIAAGEVEVVVGARSAVFAPTPHLGIIVIDEEHETSFKQDNTPRYHAREVARRRAERRTSRSSSARRRRRWNRGCGCIRQEDRLLSLPHRVEELPMPPVIIVDTRHDPRIEAGSAIGRTLEQAMRNALQKTGASDSVSESARVFAAVVVPGLRTRREMPAVRRDADLAQAARRSHCATVATFPCRGRTAVRTATPGR